MAPTPASELKMNVEKLRRAADEAVNVTSLSGNRQRRSSLFRMGLTSARKNGAQPLRDVRRTWRSAQ